MSAVASVEDIKVQTDNVARSLGFRCAPVSWEDATRGTTADGAGLSCWGGNISDVRLWEKSGELLYTLRTDNWNERLGYVSAKGVKLVVGNHIPGATSESLSNVSLRDYLQNVGDYASYSGLESTSLHEEGKDSLLTIRFQTVFLPTPDKEDAVVEFCAEVYNYNTASDEHPRNALLLCTAQGTSFQQDGAGAKKIYHHDATSGQIRRYWLEAEKSRHKVGVSQEDETAQEAAEAAARGKSTAALFIGTPAMGRRFNVQMLIQLPVEIPPAAKRAGFGGVGAGGWGAPMAMPMAMPMMMGGPPMLGATGGTTFGAAPTFRSIQTAAAAPPPPPPVGVSNAARVSRGSVVQEEGGGTIWEGLSKTNVKRDNSQHATITVTLYYTVVGGVPSAEDIRAAVDDLNALYAACPTEKHLVDAEEVTQELQATDLLDIQKKVGTQPYNPKQQPPIP